MPTYNFIHPDTKAKISITGDTPPDEATLDQIFAETAGQVPDAPKQSYADFKKAFIADQATTAYKIKDKAKDIVRAAMPIARPALETLGGVGGGLIGAGSGAFAGLGAGAVPGAAAGATLGYAGAKGVADTLEEWAGGTEEAARLANRSAFDRLVASPVQDLKTGAMFEMGGQVLAPVIGGTLRAAKAVAKGTPKLVSAPIDTTKAGIDTLAKKAAQRRIEAAVTKEGSAATQYVRNKEEYDALQRAIGDDFYLTPAQQTDDVATLKMQQSLQFTSDEAKAAMESQIINNRNALAGYMSREIPQGSLDDFLKALDADIAARNGNVAKQASALSQGDKEAASAQMRALEQQKLEELKDEAARLYGQVDMNMSVAPGMTFGQWKDARSAALNDLRSAQARASAGDASGVMPAQQRVSELEGLLERAGDMQPDEFGAMVNRYIDPAEIAKLRTANSFYRNTYVPSVRQGQTAKNLATNRTGEFKVADEISAGKYLQSGDAGLAAANDFNRLFANDPNAKTALRDFAKRDLFDSITSNGTQAPALKSAQAWVADRMPALKKLGMDNEFAGIIDALKAQEDVAGFAKVLGGVDPQYTLKALLGAKGGRQTVSAMLDLKTLVKGNAQAEAGLKKAFSDMMQKDAELVKEVGGDALKSDAKMKAFWDKYEPAMKLLYSKEEMDAMNNFRKAINLENRFGRAISGVNGTQTRDFADTANTALSKAAQWDWTGRMIRWAIDLVRTSKETSATAFVTKAQFDPKIALELKRISRIGKSEGEVAAKKAFNRAVGRYSAFASAGLRDNEN